jgi:hypothetical protein
MDLTRKVLDLETFASVAESKITGLERRLAEAERRLKEAEAELKRVKAKP